MIIRPHPSLVSFLLLGLLLAATVSTASAQPAPGSREAMWPAATAEEWKRPCLIQFQRTWEDAVALSKETGKPILVCVNMDGEIASEHYAGIRYRYEDTASLYAPYVCVIASVYRHTPRDYDEEGRRILCPRFGSVTCGEHIAIEPIIYEKFLDGRRIAPRHIAVDLDGSEMYDVFYALDTQSVFDTIQQGVAGREAPANIVRGDRSIVERVQSRDSNDRSAVEEAYAEGDGDQRRALLEAALQNPEAAPVDLLRLAIFGLDEDMSRRARAALAKVDSTNATNLIAETLGSPLAEGEREQLIGALERIGQNSTVARSLAVMHQGLSSRNATVDIDAWATAMQAEYSPAPTADPALVEERLQQQNEVFRSEDPARLGDLAETFLKLALDEDPQTDDARLLFLDAKRTAEKAARLGQESWRTDSVSAIAEYYSGDKPAAYRHAEAASARLPEDAQSWNAMAVLAIFAEARQNAIAAAIRDKKDWPKEWMSDVHTAYRLLAKHPFGSDTHVIAHYDFVDWFRARDQSQRILDEGLKRFPDSWALHDRLRARALRKGGIEALESTYTDWIARAGEKPTLRWFSAYASMVAAEFHRRRGNPEDALAAYDRAIAQYEQVIAATPDDRVSCDHYISIALAGRARVEMEAERYEPAVADLLRSIDRSAESAATLDGLNISAVTTAQMLRARLQEQSQDDLAAKVQGALDGLAPELLRPPAFEFESGPNRPPSDQRRGGRRPRPAGPPPESGNG